MTISHWPLSERPRERLLTQGATTLSNTELLAIFLRTGVKGKNALDLARDLLDRFENNIAALAHADIAQITEVSGIGKAKACQLSAALEFSRRALSSALKEGDLLQSPAKVKEWICLHLSHLPHEEFYALWLNNQNQLITHELLFRGTVDHACVYPREIVKRALAVNAAAVIFAHNHPSGSAQPSGSDRKLTKTLSQTLKLVEVRVLDHFIVASPQKLFSFSEQGLLLTHTE